MNRFSRLPIELVRLHGFFGDRPTVLATIRKRVFRRILDASRSLRHLLLYEHIVFDADFTLFSCLNICRPHYEFMSIVFCYYFITKNPFAFNKSHYLNGSRYNCQLSPSSFSVGFFFSIGTVFPFR